MTTQQACVIVTKGTPENAGEQDRCGNPTHLGVYCCDHHASELRRWLRWIELYSTWFHLETMKSPLCTDSARKAPGFGSAAPVRLDVLVALDHRSRVEVFGEDDDEEPTRSILESLHSMARLVREECDHGGPRQVTMQTEVGYLLSQLAWITRQPWVDEFAAGLRERHDEARALAKDRPDPPLAPCLNDCGAPVYYAKGVWDEDSQQWLDRARCSNLTCLRWYMGTDLVRLRSQDARQGVTQRVVRELPNGALLFHDDRDGAYGWNCPCEASAKVPGGPQAAASAYDHHFLWEHHWPSTSGEQARRLA